ncbi:TenA family protein [Tessaracoccus sp.]|uniref:TenA family protein n=1 Tax=Tessaracoccus sp. TaxID=1971211 RepID=UPI0026233F2B|nr:TenA family protein [Tessaracoccus sp.]
MFSEEAWDATAGIRARIDCLPLLVELADGTLAPARFVEYLVQDDFYLRGYARALAMLASRAPSLEAAGFWAASAGGAVAAEREMHGSLLGDPVLAAMPRSGQPSPTTRAYSAMLQAATAYEPYAVGVAAVLPCFWVYAEVGRALAATAQGIADHPYGSWVAAYDDPAFQEATRTAIRLMDEAAEAADAATRAAMLEAFVEATWYEEQFWARSYELQRWDVSVG